MADILLPEVSCTTAKEFLEALSPIGSYFEQELLDSPWLFRGQGKDWPLVPFLFRKDPYAIKVIKSFTNRNINDISELLLVERDLLVHFFEIADKRGLIVPDDSQELRDFLEMVKRLDDHVRTGDWKGRIKDKALSLMALAQHYGIPTRLLDWTRQSYIAAFFAAESATKLLEDDGIDFKKERLVVWAFYFPDLGKQDDESKKYDPIRIVSAPKATNTNLKAQQGIFTLINTIYLRDIDNKKYSSLLLSDLIYSIPELNYFKDANEVYPPLDKFLEGVNAAKDLLPHPDAHDLKEKLIELLSSCQLRKFTLPISEAPLLLKFLSKHDITYSTIYPGYHSITSDIKLQKPKE